ncbi:CoA pyrophosphatase [Clostridium sp. 'deep sea']|uniref:NUDIX hydrolase n=1 Tax=Clostridium sp. 'deep sea' TaxID=2779445 RepID=UPI0018966DC9|nr:CoA pyrophosphatase [Clostridium sp. 'deep sea']QOR34364.1 CoA pyrophosphatase [Clostridium sp. 'deep sea']
MHITEIKNKLQNRTETYAYKHKHYSVLVPLVEINNKLHLLFEVRAATLKNQPSEISFPGGRVENKETWQEAAIRESTEELGIAKTCFNWICELDIVSASHTKTIHTGLAEVNCSLNDMHPNASEVSEIFTVPLHFFINTQPDTYLVAVNCHPDETFPYDQIPNGREYTWHRGNFDVPFYYYQHRIIWGLTARIIMNFISLLK